MSQTETLFDAQRGEYLKTASIDAVEDHADPDWLRSALVAARIVCVNREEFTTDAVWVLIPEAPNEPRAIGAVMRKVKALGWAKPTDRTELSRRPECHRRPVRVWRSLLV